MEWHANNSWYSACTACYADALYKWQRNLQTNTKLQQFMNETRMHITMFAVRTVSWSILYGGRGCLLSHWRRVWSTTGRHHLRRWTVLHWWWRRFWAWTSQLSASWPSDWRRFTSVFCSIKPTSLIIIKKQHIYEQHINSKIYAKEASSKTNIKDTGYTNDLKK